MAQASSGERGARTIVAKSAGWLAATGMLLFVGALVYRYLFQYGVSNIWSSDGFVQHFPAYYHCRDALLAIVRDPAHAFEMWSPNLGLGADTMGTLSYYLGDPFSLVSVLFPAKWLEYVYEVMFFARLLAAGLAAFAYLRGMRAKNLGAIAGSLIYVFTTYTMFSALRHPYFASPLVWFPLILLGIEHVLRRRRPYLLVVAVFLAAVSSYYFFYQMTIVVIIYAVGRYLETTPRRHRLSWLAPAAVMLGGLYALGIACAAFMLWPAIDGFLTSSRAGSSAALGVFSDVDTYRSYITSLTSAYVGANSAFTGYSILGFLVLPVLFMRRAHNTTLKVLLVLFPAALLFPMVGSAFNGFAFPSYRFLFMWGLFLGAAAADVLSEHRALSGRESAAMLTGLVCYAALVLWARGNTEAGVVLALVIGTLMRALFAFEGVYGWFRRSEAPPSATEPPSGDLKDEPSLLQAAIVGLLVVNIALLAAFSFDYRFDDRLTEYMGLGKTLKKYRHDEGTAVRALPGAAVARIDKQDAASGSSDLQTTSSNDALVENYLGISSYYSVLDAGVHDYLASLDVRNQRDAFEYNGFDDRAALEALGGVRYYLPSHRTSQYVPFGFVPLSQAATATATVFENTHTLPLGYVYHSSVSSETYAALSPLERQQAMLQGVVLGDDANVGLPRATLATEVIDVPFSVAMTGTATYDEGANLIEARTPNGRVDLRFLPVPDAELYVAMTGTSFQRISASGQPVYVGSGRPDSVDAQGGELVFINIGTSGPGKTERQESGIYQYAWGDDSVLTNLGYFSEGTDAAYIRIAQPTAVHFTGLHVYAVPMAHFAERIDALAADGMTGVRLSENRVGGSVTSHGDGLLFLSVPYSRGWRATVDGKPAQIVRANVGFIGIPVSSGSHTVDLRYTTPVLPAATGVSAVGFALLALLVAGWEIALRRRRTDGRETEDGGPPHDCAPPDADTVSDEGITAAGE